MNALADYFDQERGRLAALAKATGASRSFLRAISVGERPCPPKLAVRIEIESARAVTRQQLFPQDFGEYWPELVAGAEAGEVGEGAHA